MPKLWVLTSVPARWVRPGSSRLQRGGAGSVVISWGHNSWLEPSLLSLSCGSAGPSWSHPSAVRAELCSPLEWRGLRPDGDTDRQNEKSWGEVQKVPRKPVEGKGPASNTGQGEPERSARVSAPSAAELGAGSVCVCVRVCVRVRACACVCVFCWERWRRGLTRQG